MEILFSTSLLPVIKGDEQLHYHSYQTALQNLTVHIQLCLFLIGFHSYCLWRTPLVSQNISYTMLDL